MVTLRSHSAGWGGGTGRGRKGWHTSRIVLSAHTVNRDYPVTYSCLHCQCDMLSGVNRPPAYWTLRNSYEKEMCGIRSVPREITDKLLFFVVRRERKRSAVRRWEKSDTLLFAGLAVFCRWCGPHSERSRFIIKWNKLYGGPDRVATCFALVNTQIGWECSVCYLSPFAFLFELCLLITHRDGTNGVGAGGALCQCQKRIEPCCWRSLEMDDRGKKPLCMCVTQKWQNQLFFCPLVALRRQAVDKMEKGRKTLVDGLFPFMPACRRL